MHIPMAATNSLHVNFTLVYFATHSILLASAAPLGTLAILWLGGEAADPATAMATATTVIPELEVRVTLAMASSTLGWLAAAMV